jgi:acyl-CoA thioesterase II
MSSASLNHPIWFHRSFRTDAWLLLDMSSPSASGARVATVMQEALIRLR